MSILIRKVWRDLLEARGQFISLIIIVSLGVAFYTGINATFLNLDNSSRTYFSNYNLADYWVKLNRIPKGSLKKLNSLPHIYEFSGRINTEFTSMMKSESSTLKAISLPPNQLDQKVNKVWVTKGRYIASVGSECLVEESYFKANDLKLGVPFTVYYQGRGMSVTPVGTVRSPEFVYTLKDGSELMPDPIHFGIIYMPEDYMQLIMGYQESYNEIVMKLDQNADISVLKKEIDEKLDEFGIESQYERKNQLSYSMLTEEMKGLKSVSGAFPMVFMIVAAIIIYLMMGRMVDNQRTQIGVMKAFGYSDFHVLALYMSYGILISIVGSVVGAFAGLGLGNWMTELENQYFHLPLTGMRIYPELVVPASILSLAFCLLASYQACKGAYRLSPSESMRPKAPVSGKSIFLEKAVGFWRSLSFTWRMTLRNAFRHKKRNLMTATGIMFGIAILMVSFGMMDTVNTLIRSQYEIIQNYDLKINTNRLIPKKDWKLIESLEHVVKMEPLLELGVELRNGQASKTVGLVGMEPNAKLYRVINKSGKVVSISRTGFMMPEKLANTLDLDIKSLVNAKALIPRQKSLEVPLMREVYQYVGISVFTSLEQAGRLIDESHVANSFVLKLDSSEHADELKNRIRSWKSVSGVQTKSDAMNNLKKNMDIMTASLSVMIILAGILSICVIYNVATISIYERQRELATLKVLGLRDNEIGRVIFNENYLVAIFASILAIPVGFRLGQVMSLMYETESYSFQFVISPSSYILSIIMSIFFIWISNQWLKRKIRKLDMISVLKNMD